MPPNDERAIDWRSMETAPKDGSPIMLYLHEIKASGRVGIVSSKASVVGASWHKEAECWVRDPVAGHWGVIEGEPTHWAPMLVSPIDPDAAFLESWSPSRLGGGTNGADE